MDIRMREREIERMRAPDRENSAMPKPAHRGVSVAHSPCDWDPTAGGRDGMASPKEPAATRAQLASRDGIATCEAERQSVEDHADNRRSTLEA